MCTTVSVARFVVNHGFMSIIIQAVPVADYNAWFNINTQKGLTLIVFVVVARPVRIKAIALWSNGRILVCKTCGGGSIPSGACLLLYNNLTLMPFPSYLYSL